MRKLLMLTGLLAVACGGGKGRTDAAAFMVDTGVVGGAGGGGAGGGMDTGGGAGGGGVDTGGAGGNLDTGGVDSPGARDWSRVEALLLGAAADAGVTSLGLTVWDRNDQRIYERMLGTFTPTTTVAVASASKMVSGLVLFDAIRRGELTLDSTTGQLLGWTGANKDITLRHLLSFTSGLTPEATCTLNPLVTLAACVDTIRDTAVVAAPGTRYDYGSTHLEVAARLAEVASGKTWAQLFADTLTTPLGLGAEAAYFTFPKRTAGINNPLIAGGLRASVNDYANFLALVFHRGNFRGLTVGTEALFEAQAKEPFPSATIGNSPIGKLGLPYHYGLTAWLMCETPATGCTVLSSPGAFGFTPWLDRDAGYYAILGMELDRNETDNGVVDFAVKLQQELEPLIREQL